MFKNRFPIFIPTKGRYDSLITVKSLEKIGIKDYTLVIEEEEFPKYRRTVAKENLLILDKSYQDVKKYDYCDGFNNKSYKGPGPARNFIWDYSISKGYEWHWVMDDNILGFWRQHNNQKIRVKDGAIFQAMEDFCLRYENIAMAGPHYYMFAPRKTKKPPFYLNTRIYSCNLIRNDIPFRWRGRFNEDTILSIDILKAGWCTVLFNAFLQWKTTTQTVKGGNTEAYKKDGTYLKSSLLVKTHPDVARIAYRFNRWHHYCNYKRFNQRLIRRKNIKINKNPNNYGMKLKQILPNP